MKKKLKLLLSKEDARISKSSLLLGALILFFDLNKINSYSLNKQLFNINGQNTVQHQHNVIIRINETEPEDININQKINQSCLIITVVGGSGSCDGVYWSDITGDYNSLGSNTRKCLGNEVSKTCWVKGNANDYGYVKYEWHNNDPNFDCSSQYGTFYTKVNSSSRQRVNTWKNVI